MTPKRKPSQSQLRLKAKQLAATTAKALAQPLAQAGAYKDTHTFKASILQHLSAHEAFDAAVQEYHDIHLAAARPLPKHPSQIPATIRPSGRVQASRRDPSVGQRDRQRGKRTEGGQRQGSSKKA